MTRPEKNRKERIGNRESRRKNRKERIRKKSVNRFLNQKRTKKGKKEQQN